MKYISLTIIVAFICITSTFKFTKQVYETKYSNEIDSLKQEINNAESKAVNYKAALELIKLNNDKIK